MAEGSIILLEVIFLVLGRQSNEYERSCSSETAQKTTFSRMNEPDITGVDKWILPTQTILKQVILLVSPWFQAALCGATPGVLRGSWLCAVAMETVFGMWFLYLC